MMNETSFTAKHPRAWQFVKFAFAAIAAGARTVPLGDNGAILRELAQRSAPQYGADVKGR